jgi:hypothetical protein
MSVGYFIGGAGTGKTTRAINELKEKLLVRKLDAGQKVLALTFMHGSRRRLDDRLRLLPELKNRFLCQTIDSFAYSIVCRWSDLARFKGLSLPKDELEYEMVCSTCANLLQYEVVARWVASIFPIVILDEFQDCNGNRISIVDGLSKQCTIIAAIDPFQDLNILPGSPAETWLKSNGSESSLTTIHRTKKRGLIEVFSKIRSGTLPENFGSDGIYINYGFNNKNGLMATARALSWRGIGNTAILCPTSYGRCAFFRFVVEGLVGGPVKIKVPKSIPPKYTEVGPFIVPTEKGTEEAEEELWACLGIRGKDPEKIVKLNKISLPNEIRGIERLHGWLLKQKSLKGKAEFSIGEIQRQIKRVVQRLRAHSHQSDKGIRAMTIHQAKNREFESVILLWPYQLDGNKEKQKRLFYNGLTRAKAFCSVIIQGNPNEKRFESMFQ